MNLFPIEYLTVVIPAITHEEVIVRELSRSKNSMQTGAGLVDSLLGFEHVSLPSRVTPEPQVPEGRLYGPESNLIVPSKLPQGPVRSAEMEESRLATNITCALDFQASSFTISLLEVMHSSQPNNRYNLLFGHMGVSQIS
jgi:hypothetical protein